jgi:hypothetical protein
MKNNKLYTVFGIIIGILILIGASYLGRSIMNRQDKVKNVQSNNETLSDFSSNGYNCHNRFKYFVITRTDVNSNAGEDILVKDKTSTTETIKCDYQVGVNDFELLNTPLGDSSNSQYFAYIDDNFLVVDEGTGINRNFAIYDLGKREKVFNDAYSADLLDLKDGVLTYWHRTNDIPNKINCAKVEEYNKMGGAKIEAKMSINLSNPKDREINEFRCSYAE